MVETRGFESDVSRLLHLVIHALYSHKEIFLRELISNASDAADKLRYEGIAHPEYFEDAPNTEIQIDFDEKARTLTIRDNGIGMSMDEIVKNLGTIARSGTQEFLKSLSGDKAKDSALIGQFGVGFYASFMVADKVTVYSRRAGLPADQGVCWESEGKGEYTVAPYVKKDRGTEIVMHLKPEEDEFLNPMRLKHIIVQYSDHITVPVLLKNKEQAEGDDAAVHAEYERVNQANALWVRPRSEVTDEEYISLYKHIAHDYQDPLLWSHNKVEGKLEYTSLLYIPQTAPHDLFHAQQSNGVKLYVKRVFIMEDAKTLLPTYLRFVRGIVDSNDLPLNVSREILQNSKIMDSLRNGITKRVLGMLNNLATQEPEKYSKFWKAFGNVLKEGPAEDYSNKDEIAGLLRFASTHTDTDVEEVTLKEYCARMKEGQTKIYYVAADSFLAAKNSPHLEIFRKKGIEVLLLTQRIDEWLVAHLPEFEGKAFQSVAQGALEASELDKDTANPEETQQAEAITPLLTKIQEILKDKVKEVRASVRLTQSPACLVAQDQGMTLQMQRILRSAGQKVDFAPVLEINPTHPLIQQLETLSPEALEDWALVLFDQALLAEGGTLEDPASFVQRSNRLLLGARS